jgi:hypothetical protein
VLCTLVGRRKVSSSHQATRGKRLRSVRAPTSWILVRGADERTERKNINLISRSRAGPRQS